jgi:hypothetical protein
MAIRKLKRYGWVADLPDHRDFVYSPALGAAGSDLVDLRPQCQPVWDQGQLGSVRRTGRRSSTSSSRQGGDARS